MPVPELSHLSYSSLSTYQLCARSWRFKYVDKVRTPTTPALAFGTAWHGTVETVIRNNAARQGSDVEAIWRERWGLAAETVQAWDTETPMALESDGLRMLGSLEVIDLLSRIRPLVWNDEPAIEVKVELRVPGVPLPVLGFIDCIGEDGIPIDFKTAERVWTADRAHGELQPLFYLAALNQLGYRNNPGYRFRHIVFPKTGRTRVQVLEHTHTPAEMFWLFGAVRDCWAGINGGIYPPNPSAWKCSERWCDFWARCRGKR